MGPEGGHGRWWNNPKMIQKLNLTDAQRKDMDATLQAHREKLIDLHANLQKAELEMEPLMHQDQPNEGAILSQIDKVASARAELEKANARFLLAIRSKLTPDQWKQVQDMRANRGQEREGRDGRGAGGQGRGNWQGHRPPPAGGQPGATPPPPSGPQSMNETGADQRASQGGEQ
jgi:Spy/CpxP family protein refolding chaperone